MLPQVTYGLTKRARPSERDGGGAGPSGQAGTEVLSVTSPEWEAAEKYRQDMERGPPEVQCAAAAAFPPACLAGARIRDACHAGHALWMTAQPWHG